MGIDLDKLALFVRRQAMPPASGAPEQAYGVWLLEQGPTRTWVRLEKPKISIVEVDRDKDEACILNGDYSVARDGRVFGIITGHEQSAGDRERTLALWRGDEGVWRRTQTKETRLPYCCSLRPAGETLIIDELRGVCFSAGRERSFQGVFHKVSLGRPGYVKAPAPLGSWELEPPGVKARVNLHILADRFDFTILDRVTGQRLHLEGEYDMTAEALFYAVLTKLEISNGNSTRVTGPVLPTPLYFRFGWYGPALQILDFESLCFDKKTNHTLAGRYAPQGRK
jgi:hypothetical protein